MVHISQLDYIPMRHANIPDFIKPGKVNKIHN